jgi:serine/threonine-protein phosphatase 6 regulatory ankyrin repeat subunit B
MMKYKFQKRILVVLIVIALVVLGLFIWSYEQPKLLNYKLLAAAQNGNIEVIGNLLNQGIRVDEKFGGDGDTALYRAAAYGHTKAVKFLLEHGADVNASNDVGTTALISSSYHGYAEIVSILLNAGADVNAMDTRHNFTALQEAARKGHLEIVKMLIARGADINIKTVDGRTALERAETEGYTEIVKVLKEANLKQNRKSRGQF